jgi:hypothetical protein
MEGIVTAKEFLAEILAELDRKAESLLRGSERNLGVG